MRNTLLTATFTTTPWLRATIAGTVASTGTAPGTVVQPGALLAVITPD